jgi:hypothetical protein
MSQPQIWNRYAYCLGNPLRFNDPTGLAHVEPDGHFVGDKNGEYNKDLDAIWSAKKKIWNFLNSGTPVRVGACDDLCHALRGSSGGNSLFLHVPPGWGSLFQTAERLRSLGGLPSKIQSVPIPRDRQPDIDQCGANLFCRLNWINNYTRRHLNVGNLIFGGTNRERGGRGRFHNAEDAQSQYEDIQKAQDAQRQGKGPGLIDETTKSRQRMENEFRNIRSQEDLEFEFGEGELQPIEP